MIGNRNTLDLSCLMIYLKSTGKSVQRKPTVDNLFSMTVKNRSWFFFFWLYFNVLYLVENNLLSSQFLSQDCLLREIKLLK